MGIKEEERINSDLRFGASYSAWKRYLQCKEMLRGDNCGGRGGKEKHMRIVQICYFNKHC